MSTPGEVRKFLERFGITQTWAQHIATAGLGGVDYGVPYGTLLPALDGAVLEYGPGSGLAWYNAGLGKAVAYRYPDGHRTVLGHNSKVEGGRVYSGNSGTVRPTPTAAQPYNGSHVHAHDVMPDGRTRRPPFSLATGGAGGGGINQGDDMRLIRHPNGSITTVGETTYQHHSMATYVADSAVLGPYVQVDEATYNLIVANTQVRLAYLKAQVGGTSGAAVDVAAIAAKVEQNLADDFVRLADQIATVNANVDDQPTEFTVKPA